VIMQRHEAVPAPFAVADDKQVSLPVDIAGGEPDRLRDAQSARIDDGEGHAVGGLLHQLEKRADLVLREYHRQPPGPPRPDNVQVGERPFERGSIEKTDAAQIDLDRTSGELQSLDQVQEEAADLLLCQKVRGTAVVLGQHPDGVDVVFDGPRGVAG